MKTDRLMSDLMELLEWAHKAFYYGAAYAFKGLETDRMQAEAAILNVRGALESLKETISCEL